MIASLLSEFIAHLWQSTLVAGVVWLMAVLLRGNRARVRYWLWTAASAKFLVPFSLLMSLGAQFEWRTAPAIAQPAATFVMEEILATPVVSAVASTTEQPTAVWPWVLASVWVVGFLAVLFWWWRQWRPVKEALRQARPIELESAHDFPDLAVMSSPWTFEPGVVGIWRPVLLVPEGLKDQLTSAQMKAVVSHELCHIRCHDNLAAAVHMLVEAVFWFHPLVWWMGGRLMDERERACDEAVVREGHDPADYIEGILTVCRFTLRAPLACVAGVSGAELRARIEWIVRNELGTRLTLGRRVAVALVAVVLIGVPLVAGVKRIEQSPVIGDTAKFEVASVRSNNSGGFAMNLGRPFKGSRYSATNVSLRHVIALAYDIPVERIVEGPSWIGAATNEYRFIGGDRFDIAATLPQGAGVEQIPAMLRGLLADRFKLIVHTEPREVPVYRLVVARDDGRLGPQMHKVSIDCEAAQAAGTAIPAAKPGERGVCEREVGGAILGRGQRIAALARMLSMYADRPVVDKTGLSGGFDFDLRFPELVTPAEATGPRADPATGIFAALQEQLGLKLESTRGELEFVVINTVQHPTEN